MDEKPKKIEAVKDKVLTLIKIQTENDTDKEGIVFIKRVSFVFEGKTAGNENIKVTWKPKMQKVEYVRGIESITTTRADMEALFKMLGDLPNALNLKGFIKMKVNYQLMSTLDGENEPVCYRFITSEDAFKSWSIVTESEIREDRV